MTQPTHSKTQLIISVTLHLRFCDSSVIMHRFVNPAYYNANCLGITSTLGDLTHK